MSGNNRKIKRKVLFIGPSPPPYSGPELGMQQFLESSLQEEFDISFLKTNFRKTNVDKGVVDRQMFFAFFKFVYQLISMILIHRPVLAYYPITPTQTGWVGRDAWCLVICRIFRVKTIIHLRGGHLKLNFKTFHPIVQKIVRFACKSVSLALVQAGCLGDQYEGLVPDERVKVLYQALRTGEYENEHIDKYNENEILFMGHMTQAKGYCDLVRAIPKVADKFPEVVFSFAGTLRKGERGVFFDQTNGKPLEYEDPFEVQDFILNSQYKANYQFLGIISGAEKLERLRNINIFVLPSYSEGFSRAILECMSMGKPIVCTPVGAHREVVKNNEHGLVISPGDVDGLADSLIRLLGEKAVRKRIAETNYSYVRECFDLDVIAGQLTIYINQVIDGDVG